LTRVLCYDIIENRKNTERKMGKVQKRRVRILLIHLLLIGAFAVYAFVFKCPMREWLGVCCPGCGLTRACLSALRLDIASALYYHPLFWLFPPFVFLYIHRRPFRLPFKSKVWNVALGGVIGLMLIQYIVRLAIGSDVVYIDVERGLLYRFILNAIG